MMFSSVIVLLLDSTNLQDFALSSIRPNSLLTLSIFAHFAMDVTALLDHDFIEAMRLLDLWVQLYQYCSRSIHCY